MQREIVHTHSTGSWDFVASFWYAEIYLCFTSLWKHSSIIGGSYDEGGGTIIRIVCFHYEFRRYASFGNSDTRWIPASCLDRDVLYTVTYFDIRPCGRSWRSVRAPRLYHHKTDDSDEDEGNDDRECLIWRRFFSHTIIKVRKKELEIDNRWYDTETCQPCQKGKYPKTDNHYTDRLEKEGSVSWPSKWYWSEWKECQYWQCAECEKEHYKESSEKWATWKCWDLHRLGKPAREKKRPNTNE